MNKLFLAFFAILFVASCSTTKPTVNNPTPKPEVRELEEMVVKAKPIHKDPEKIVVPVYQGTRTLDNDLLHSKLAVSFDMPKEELVGQATLTLKPKFYPVNTLILDAKSFVFNKVKLNSASGKGLKYDYDGLQITIHLGRYYDRTETYKIYLDYIAQPTKGPIGGSAAIQSDQGLYFIDPNETDPEKPTQIWTQGETESNSKWCPTIDSPNESATHEIAITVADKFKTLSNGVFIRGQKNADGTRTDYWKQDMTQAPYLMMMAIGEFEIVRDTWNGKPIAYYMEPQYKDYATDIFPYTKELLTFYSDILGVPYPWQKYDQVVVRDYVSGAMENTTAVIFQEFVNGTKRELIGEQRNELIVAHEMFHHWFGDYVTCESWSNTTLNEGFANYSEYLWLEHKHGKEEADHHLLEELNGYVNNTPYHPLINYHYKSREDMFDGHSYNKGGCTLHMLRNVVGDEAFFASLKRYLTTNAHTSVELAELRMAFEDELGIDMHWFFDQWYLHSGHPEIEFRQSYDASAKKLTVTLEQVQSGEDVPEVYLLPLDIDIYTSAGKATNKTFEMNARKQSFTFDVDFNPAVVELDPKGVLLGTIDYLERSVIAWKELYHFNPSYRSKANALRKLIQPLQKKGELGGFAKALLKDSFWEFRQVGLYILEQEKMDGEVIGSIEQIAKSDKNVKVKAQALKLLATTGDQKYVPLMEQTLNDNTLAYSITGAALSGLSALNPAKAAKSLKSLEDIDNQSIVTSISEIYAKNPSMEQLPFFERNLSKTTNYEAVDFISNYVKVVSEIQPTKLAKLFEQLKNMATDMKQDAERRFACTKVIYDNTLSADTTLRPTLKNYIQEIKEKETLGELKSIYKQMF